MVDISAPQDEAGVERFGGLERWRFVPDVLIVGIAALLPLLLLNLQFVYQIEQWARDYRVALTPRPAVQDKNVVVVTITDQVLDKFAYRSPVDRAYLARLLEQLAAKHARAIGLDVLFDRPTEPQKDDLMRQTLAALPVPVVVSFVDDPRLGIDAPALKYLLDFVPPADRGMANVITDHDGTVRKIFDGEAGPGGAYIPGLVRQMLARTGIETPPVRQIIAYRPRTIHDQSAIPEFSADIVPLLPEEWFAGKYVLVGGDSKLVDRHRTPFAILSGDIDGLMPGVVIHAQGLAQLLEGTNPSELSGFWSLMLAAVLAAAATVLGHLSMPVWLRIAALGGLVGIVLFGAKELYDHWAVFIPIVPPSLSVMVAALLTDQVVGRQFREQRNLIRAAMGRIVSPKVGSLLLKNPESLSLTGARREMTFLFTDVASFTSMAEAIGSERLTVLLNEYLTGLCNLIQERDGTVCRFIGDAVFALWNAPAQQTDHHWCAVDCALAIDAYAERYAETQRELGVPFGHTRIGIHSGEAMVGWFGSPQRMEYTALGDNVNLAARLESVNKFFGTRLCVSESVVPHVPDIRFRAIARVIVKGKSVPMTLYEPWSAARLASGYDRRYAEAYALLEAEDPAAFAAFDGLKREDPEDGCVRFHLERLRRGETGAVVKMEEK